MIKLIHAHSGSTLTSTKYYFIKVQLKDFQKHIMLWRNIATSIPVVIVDDSAKVIADIDAILINMQVTLLKY